MPPPGANGTTILMVWSGYPLVCAKAGITPATTMIRQQISFDALANILADIRCLFDYLISDLLEMKRYTRYLPFIPNRLARKPMRAFS